MHLLIVLSAIVCASVEIIQGANVFHKCCANNQGLMKVFDDEAFNLSFSYECIDRESAWTDYNITITPLFIGKNISLEYGIPDKCDDNLTQEILAIELFDQSEPFNGCFDRLVAELQNGTVKAITPVVVGIKSCVKNEERNTSENNLIINYYRKCCPRGQSYDSNYHICRDTEVNNSEEWLLKRLKMNDNHIYEVDNGLRCELNEYGIELRQRFFSLKVNRSTLNIFSKKGDGSGEAAPGQWCLDREFSSSELVARVCDRSCSKYGAFCVRKCCPIGYHYRPMYCGRLNSKCMPNVDDVLFDISDYLEPLQHANPEITDVMGLRFDLHCNGRVVLNKSLERDRHRLTPDGRLISPISVGDGYCFEAFDNRFCPGGSVFITAVNCFIKAPEVVKNFQLICISSVCMALTLLVYISIPELRNLHGRTLICHVSMMLLAFCCLARAQYSRVADNTACTLIGYGIYFGFVAAFAWLNVMCFDIWWTFGSVRSVQPMRKANTELRRFLWYSLYAWSTAILLTLVMFILDKYPVSDYLDANMGQGLCWFGTYQNARNDWPHYIYFVIPMGLVTCVNFVLWVLTARHCARVKSEVHRLQAGSMGDRVKRRFRVDRAKYVLTGKLWIVMGAGWISELLSTIVSQPWWLWTIIDLMNELQGVLIFLILVMKPKLYYLIRKRLGLEKPDAQKNGTSSSARTSSTFLSRALSTDERTNTRLSLQNNVKQP
ncbi:hypothetical protein HW555_007491 [Spodoptera exigua]|uniref:G-protein coupled receptors family 2 profile 2 domain-containing protein n=1 Tax=Spodoptera exigua TaxID=7107 RepID=A0A835GGS9_SPOEX|nr:hypothetical protein HW555_007491 [Spodoptera exigua]